MTFIPTLTAAPPVAAPAPETEALVETGAVRVLAYRCLSGAHAEPVAECYEATSLILVTGGAFCYHAHGYRRLVEPGTMILGVAADDYACSHDYGGGDTSLVFQLSPELLDVIDGPGRLRHGAVLAGGPRLEALALATADGVGLEEMAYALAREAFARVGGREEVPPSLRRADRDRAHAAAQLIEARYAEPLTLEAIASAVGTSPFHFLRIFKQELGLTPHQYLLRVRLRHAVRFLRSPDARVTEVAYAVGFGDLSHFIRTFKRQLGLSPDAFRRGRLPA